MGVYRIDVLRERLSCLEMELASCSGFGFYDEKRADEISEKIADVLNEIEICEEGNINERVLD